MLFRSIPIPTQTEYISYSFSLASCAQKVNEKFGNYPLFHYTFNYMEVTSPSITAAPSSGGSFLGEIGTLLSTIFLNALFIAILLAVIFVAWKVFRKFLFAQKLAKNSNVDRAFLQIKIPQNNQQKEAAFENFLKSLHRVLPNNAHLSLEMGSANQFLSFYIVISKSYKNVLESQLYAQFPEEIGRASCRERV